jgi:hypothetical protein
MSIKLSILILTQPSRAQFLERLLAVLAPQIQQHSDIEVATRIFDPKMQIGENRQEMVDRANGEYVCFIDDDDLVPANYISRIYPLLDGVDYIGFRLQYYVDGAKQAPTFHSLRYSTWNADQEGYYRDLSHVNPIRRELSLLSRYEGGNGEDSRWGDRLRALGVVKTEHFIDEVMYLYLFRSDKTDAAPIRGTGSTGASPRMPVRSSEVAQPKNYPPCVNCQNPSTTITSNGFHCNQCGHDY